MKRVYIRPAVEPLTEFLTMYPGVTREQAIAVIRDYNKFLLYRREFACDICDVRLTPEERATIPPTHFLRTCEQHRNLGIYFQLEAVRKQHGYKPRQYYYNND